jgi:uncharacterized membrane protein YdbT with pleckstrin-like domain
VSYTEKSLVEGENLIYIARLHWIIFLLPIVMLLLANIFLHYFHFLYARYIALFFVALGVLLVLIIFGEYFSTEFGVTNKRIIVKVGMIGRTARELFLNRIESIQLQQTILGRILGYGAVIPAGTGGDKARLHSYIDNPMKLKKIIDEQIIK